MMRNDTCSGSGAAGGCNPPLRVGEDAGFGIGPASLPPGDGKRPRAGPWRGGILSLPENPGLGASAPGLPRPLRFPACGLRTGPRLRSGPRRGPEAAGRGTRAGALHGCGPCRGRVVAPARDGHERGKLPVSPAYVPEQVWRTGRTVGTKRRCTGIAVGKLPAVCSRGELLPSGCAGPGRCVRHEWKVLLRIQPCCRDTLGKRGGTARACVCPRVLSSGSDLRGVFARGQARGL